MRRSRSPSSTNFQGRGVGTALRRHNMTVLVAQEGKHLAPDAGRVGLVEIYAHGSRPDHQAGEAKVDDLLEPLGAVVRRPGYRELIDQLVAAGLMRVESDLSWSPTLPHGDAPAR